LTETSIAPLVHSFEELLTGPVEQLATFVEDELKFDYFFSRKGAKKLLVFFPSALREGRRRLPAFHRWSWAEQFADFDVLCVSDPTMHLHQEMLGGWLVGNKSTWVLENVLKHIAKLQQSLGYDDVVFCGSSLGGFCAIQSGAMAETFGISVGKGGVYAENPQINLFSYKFFKHIDLLAQVGFDAPNREAMADEYAKRFNVVTTLEEYGHVPHGLVVIKESDAHHFSNQVPQLATYVDAAGSSSLAIEVIPADVDPSGHTPLDIHQMKERIQAILTH
jgi:hypothetical protein